MATVAIGDIHGNLAALEGLLAAVLPTMRSDDVLVFLGDYIDRGPDTRGCLDRILRLRQTADFMVVTLRGNHEDWMLAVLLRKEVEQAGIRLITERVPIPL